MLTTSAMRQGSGEGVEPQPAECGATQLIPALSRHPLGDFPWGHEVTLAFFQQQARVGPQSEIHGLGQSVLFSQLLLTADGITTQRQDVAPVRVVANVPAPDAAV